MKIPFKAKLRNSKGGKDPNWVVSIPIAYVKNGLLHPGQEYQVEIEAIPAQAMEEKKEATYGRAGFRTQTVLPEDHLCVFLRTESGELVEAAEIEVDNC